MNDEHPTAGVGASAHAACRSPCGPGHVIGAVASAFSDPGGGGLAAAVRLEVTAPVDVAGASVVGFLFSLHAAIRAPAAAAAYPEQRQPAQRLTSGQQSVDMIGGNLFGNVSLEWSHLREYAPEC